MKKIMKLTESDLTRIIKRVVNEQSEPNMDRRKTSEEQKNISSCIESSIKKLKSEYRGVIKKVEDYNKLEWWEWYDKMNLSPTPDEIDSYRNYIQKKIRIMFDCEKKYNK